MSSFNKVILIGNVGKDVEVKTTSTGSKYAYVSLATSEKFKDKKTGEKKENTTWHSLKVYEPIVDIFSQYVKKGSKICIDGSLRNNEYEKDGQKIRSTEVVVKNMVFLDKINSQEINDNKRNPYAFDDEIPF